MFLEHIYLATETYAREIWPLDMEILSFSVMAYVNSLWQCVVMVFLCVNHTVEL